MSVLDVQARLDVQVLGQRVGPKLALDIESDDVSLDPRTDLEGIAHNAGLERIKGGGQLALQITHVETHYAEQMARAEINDGTKGFGIIFKAEGAIAFLGQMSAGAEQPLQVAEDTLAVALKRNHSLGPALLRVLRLVIGQPVEQTRLKFFNDGKFRHTLESSAGMLA